MATFRLKNLSDTGICTRTREFWIQSREPFGAWKTHAIVFDYNEARKIMKFLKGLK